MDQKPTKKAMTLAWNDLVGVEPFKTDAVEQTGNSKGFATMKQRTQLTALKVLVGTTDIPKGSTIFVNGDLCVSPDAKRIYDFDGEKVIFLSTKEIKAAKVEWLMYPTED